jgi:hypothetical protein
MVDASAVKEAAREGAGTRHDPDDVHVPSLS